MGGFLVMLLVGFIAGAIAKAVMPGSSREPSGWIMTILLGIVGSMVGGFLGRLVGIHSSNLIGEILVSAVGAMVLIGVMRYFAKS
jgi:uncharacterized membrane protein YeaQ/YmgE (transglycosylase-associated protein family)